MARADAQGNSSSAHSYAATDAHLPAATRLYYRLQQVDQDGTAAYTPVQTVTLGGPALLTLAPNPARTAATLTLPAAAQTRTITVADALGRVVLKTTLPAQTATLTLDVAGLAPGVYTVRCAAATARLVVE